VQPKSTCREPPQVISGDRFRAHRSAFTEEYLLLQCPCSAIALLQSASASLKKPQVEEEPDEAISRLAFGKPASI